MTSRSPADIVRLARLLLTLLTLALPHSPLRAETIAENRRQGDEHTALLDGEAIVRTVDLEDGVTGVTGKIRIDAPPGDVWNVITDYDNHKNFIPRIIESRLLSDSGKEQVLLQTGRTGVLFFRKTVQLKLIVHGEPYSRIGFRMLEGDFKVYRGGWLVEPLPDGEGSILTFHATIKPDFFAPSFFVRSVQKNDLPKILEAVKQRAEALQEVVYHRNAEKSGP